jgi:ABC-type transporter lipoprotein component MlaA
MAKIAELIADIIGPEFSRDNVQNLANNVGSVVQKLNTTYQQQLVDEYEAFTLFMS